VTGNGDRHGTVAEAELVAVRELAINPRRDHRLCRNLAHEDAAARSPDGTVICGVFNVNRAQAATSLRRLATLDTTVACFGHGEPLTHDGAAALRTAAQRLPADTVPQARDTPGNQP
jgi:hypothetical protein